MSIERKQDNSRNVLRLSVRSLCSYSTLFDVIIKKESQILMQRLAEVIFAQGLRGIRLSHVEDLPISIASAYDKPTAAVNDFFFFLSEYNCLFHAFIFCSISNTLYFFPVSIVQENLPSQISASQRAQRQTLDIYVFCSTFWHTGVNGHSRAR